MEAASESFGRAIKLVCDAVNYRRNGQIDGDPGKGHVAAIKSARAFEIVEGLAMTRGATMCPRCAE